LDELTNGDINILKKGFGPSQWPAVTSNTEVALDFHGRNMAGDFAGNGRWRPGCRKPHGGRFEEQPRGSWQSWLAMYESARKRGDTGRLFAKRLGQIRGRGMGTAANGIYRCFITEEALATEESAFPRSK